MLGDMEIYGGKNALLGEVNWRVLAHTHMREGCWIWYCFGKGPGGNERRRERYPPLNGFPN